MSGQKLSIVLPCYNPPEGWTVQVINSMSLLSNALKDMVSEIKLVIVNDGSDQNVSDKEKKEIQIGFPSVQFVEYEQNKGKGYALRKGVMQADAHWVVYTDIDFPYEEDSLVRIVRSLINGNALALGHRGKDYYEKTPGFRKAISKTLRWVLKRFLRLPTDDSQCGLKGFNYKGAEVFLSTKIDRFLFDLEFIKLATKRKMKIDIVRVSLKPKVVFSKVNLGILLRESGNFLRVLFRK